MNQILWKIPAAMIALSFLAVAYVGVAQPMFERNHMEEVAAAAAAAQPKALPGNSQYKSAGVAFFYPNSMTVDESDWGSSVKSVLFQNSDGQQLHMFVVPFNLGTAISESAKINISTVQRTSVSGTPAITFTGFDTVLATTSEEWFVHKGSIYEISVPSSQQSLLDTIVSSLQLL
jgi:hypothetical protein